MTIKKNIQNIYFIGIGGIGMSALARYFKSIGVKVSGYDKTRTALTTQLEKEGFNIRYEERLDLIDTTVDLVVYTPAIPKNHSELCYYQQNGFLVVKRSDVLQWITENSYNICVGGTHGKTTISTMVAHLLRASGYGSTAFLGGISTNYQTNYWSVGTAATVIEADEYDRSFLKLVPDIAVITAIDADHLDIYGTYEEVEKSFVEFSTKLKSGGLLVYNYALLQKVQFNADHQLSYALNNSAANVYAENITVVDGSYHFNVQSKDWQLNNVILNIGGLHNVENMLAAITICKYLNIDDEKILQAVAQYKGVKRRFEYHLKRDNQNQFVLIDDYAHHPEELRALISGVRSLYTGEPMLMVFQPHLFSRTNDLKDDFAKVLDEVEDVVLLPIYPARELPMPGVTSELIQERMMKANVHCLSKEDMYQYVQSTDKKIIVMAGAGDIDVCVHQVKQILMNKS